jgi:cytochrome b subunit of formate dehydrogenase
MVCNPRLFLALGAVVGLALVAPPTSHAADPDNCLLCHQFRGLTHYDADADRVHVYFVDPDYLDQLEGPHARLRCTDCHRREEVAVIPHKPVTPVNCTTTCHLEAELGQAARRFSHQPVATALAKSIHNPAVFAELEFAGGPLLEEGQSNCLYCHDEPVFRQAADLFPTLRAVDQRTFERCDVCHAEQVPVDVRYYMKHVAARLAPARPPLEQAQVCAVCHVDPRVMEQFELSNSIASFVRSFHGKAALLGYNETADCVACHAPTGASVHRVLEKTNPMSSVHADNVADTCRSLQCHPGADVSFGSAGVHLDLPTARGSLEFWVAFGFIVLTIVSFGPSLVMCLMELFQIVIGRHHTHGHRTHALAERVLAAPGGRERLKRFTVNQRWQHWILVVLFALLVATGFPMKFAEHQWASATIAFFGGLPTARHIHHWAGIALVVGFAAHGVYAFATLVKRARERLPSGERRGWIRGTFLLPMIIKPSDLLKANQYMLYLFGLRKHPPTFDRFTIKEKFEYLGVFWGTTLLGLTGMILWGEQFFSHYVSGRIFNIALIAHTYEAFLAVIHVGILHIANVTLSPHVFPLSPATITGDTPTGELAEQHSEFVEDAAKDLGIEPEGGDHG